MKSLKEFLNDFINNKGHFVFLSFAIAKICGFAGAWVVIHLLPRNEYGILSMVLSLLAVFMPFTGFGSTQSLLRYGSIGTDKRELSSYFFYRGFVLEVILVLVFLLCSVFYVGTFDGVFKIFVFSAVRLFGVYFQNHIQAYCRISGSNHIFARINNVVNISGLCAIVVLTYFFKLNGYLIAIALAPFLSLFWIKKEMFSDRKFIPKMSKEMWKFGVFTALTSLASDALFSADVLFLGFLLNEVAAADYKVAILLPANITFLAISFMQTDFPVLSKRHTDKAFLKSYVVNYYKVFTPICILIFLVFFIFRNHILEIFGTEYNHNSTLMMILLIGFNFGMLTRNLYGNLLPAVGKIEINTWVSAGSILLLLGLAWILVPETGIEGMGIAMSASLLISGFVYMYFFFRYLKNLPD